MCELAAHLVSSLIRPSPFRPLKDDVFRKTIGGDPFERGLPLLADYIDAESRGKNIGECSKVYGMCPFSIRSFLPKVFQSNLSQ